MTQKLQAPNRAVDTHCHLYWEDFNEDLSEVLERAREAGVDHVVVPAIDRETGARTLEIAARFPGVVFAALGIHPSEIESAAGDGLDWISEGIRNDCVIAIGEIGLDVYRGEKNLKQQEDLFARQLELALDHNLPAIIHHRAAGDRTLAVIREIGNSRGVFHCFSEDKNYAFKVLDQGLNISFTGNITFKKSRLPEVAAAVPLNRLLLETDAPFMAPVPYRGKRCEPAHVLETAAKLAEIHQTTLDEVCRVTTLAAEQLFSRKEKK